MKSYYRDVHELHTNVHAVQQKGSSLLVTFDDTLFYPGGGGQPHDLGRVESATFSGTITSVDEKDDVMHTIVPLHGELNKGDHVKLILDTKRREALVRMHTGEHILFKSVQKTIPDTLLDKIDLGEEESKLFIHCKSLSWQQLFAAERLANSIIAENRSITEKEHRKQDALSIEGLRIKPERIPGDTVRVITIDRFDLSACRGVHGHSTGIVGSVLITHYSKTAKGAELRFKTCALKDAFELAAITRDAAALLGVPTQELLAHIERLQKEVLSLKEKYRAAAGKLALAAQREQAGRVTLVWNLTSGVEKKQLSDTSLALCTEGCVVLLIDTDAISTVVLATHASTGIDAAKLLSELLAHMGGKGGGRERLAMGSFTGSVDSFLSLIKEQLSKS